MSQYGASCNPSSHFPDPNRRIEGAGRAIAPNRRVPRHPTFFSRRLYRVSNILQNPTTITLREFAILVLALFALYRGFVSGKRMYEILARQDVGLVCGGRTAMQCLWLHLWMCFWLGYEWASQIVPWIFVAAVLVFFGDEVLWAARRKLRR